MQQKHRAADKSQRACLVALLFQLLQRAGRASNGTVCMLCGLAAYSGPVHGALHQMKHVLHVQTLMHVQGVQTDRLTHMAQASALNSLLGCHIVILPK